MQPLISIIIPVKNGGRTIRKCLGSIFSLHYQNFEVLIVNDGSTDSTKDIIGSFKVRDNDGRGIEPCHNLSGTGEIPDYSSIRGRGINLIVIDTDGIGPSEARNLAIKQAKGEYIAFTDGDCMVNRDWLSELLKGFDVGSELLTPNSELIAGVGGSQLSPEDDSEFGKTLADFMNAIGIVIDYIKPRYASLLKSHIKKTRHNPTCNVLYKKEIFDKVGGFLKGMWPGEDVEFDYRVTKAGYVLMYNPGAAVYHYRTDNMEKFKKMMFNYGRVQAELVRRHGFFRKLQFVPLVLLFCLIFEAIIIFLSWKKGLALFLVALIMVLFYFSTRTRSLKNTFIYTKLFFVTLFCWNIGFLKGLKKNG